MAPSTTRSASSFGIFWSIGTIEFSFDCPLQFDLKAFPLNGCNLEHDVAAVVMGCMGRKQGETDDQNHSIWRCRRCGRIDLGYQRFGGAAFQSREFRRPALAH